MEAEIESMVNWCAKSTQQRRSERFCSHRWANDCKASSPDSKGGEKLTEQDVKAALREVRLALLEADVNFKVVRDFIGRVQERAVGIEVLESLTPGQQVIKIVNDELCELMGGEQLLCGSEDRRTNRVFCCWPVCKGQGRRRARPKLAVHLKNKGRRPLLVAVDVYRPAAIKQLQILGEQIGVPVYAEPDSKDVVGIATAGVAHVRQMAMMW